MFLFASSQGSECEAEARELLRRSAEAGTSRGRYVSSVIESVIKTLDFRKKKGRNRE